MLTCWGDRRLTEQVNMDVLKREGIKERTRGRVLTEDGQDQATRGKERLRLYHPVDLHLDERVDDWLHDGHGRDRVCARH